MANSKPSLRELIENVAAVRAMAACTDLLLLADGDTGYGNAVNVYHTVRAFDSGSTCIAQ